MSAPTYYEFFAGAGMAGAGLGAGWRRLLANDIDPAKAAAHLANFGDCEHFRLADIHTLTTADLPGIADLAWASFPCQDLSLAGAGAGLAGSRSGTVWAFWRLIGSLVAESRAPRLVVLENVVGTLTSHGGGDFAAICAAFSGHGYQLGPLVIDAALFRPQSRPRLFLVGVRGEFDRRLQAPAPEAPFHPPALRRAVSHLPRPDALVWWRLPEPARRNLALADIIDDALPCLPTGATEKLLNLMTPAHRDRVEVAKRGGGRTVGTLCRRMRAGAQRAEVRFDGLAGCLRTPAGGSSRQFLLIIDGGEVRARLLSPRECARLMGLGDEYRLPAGATDAWRLTGDGVVVDVVRHLAAHLLEPLIRDVSARAVAQAWRSRADQKSGLWL